MASIIKAAKFHISRGGFHNSTTTLRQADYFIKKTIIIDGEKEIISDLLTVLEEMDDLGDHRLGTDWTSKLR